jgi:hypothetical protein
MQRETILTVLRVTGGVPPGGDAETILYTLAATLAVPA